MHARTKRLIRAGAMAAALAITLPTGAAFADTQDVPAEATPPVETTPAPEVEVALEEATTPASIPDVSLQSEVVNEPTNEPASQVVSDPITPDPVPAPEAKLEPVVDSQPATPPANEEPSTPSAPETTPAPEVEVIVDEAPVPISSEVVVEDEVVVCEACVSMPGTPYRVSDDTGDNTDINAVQVPRAPTPTGFQWQSARGAGLAPGTQIAITPEFSPQTVIARVDDQPIRYCFEDGSIEPRFFPFEYIPQPGDPVEVTPIKPVQTGNVISGIPQTGIVFTDDNGTVVNGPITLAPGQTLCLFPAPAEGFWIRDEITYADGYCFTFVEEPVDTRTVIEPVKPVQTGNVVELIRQPDQFYTISNEPVIGLIELTPDTEEKPLLICSEVSVPSETVFEGGVEFICWSYQYVKDQPPVPTDPPTPVDPPKPTDPPVDPAPHPEPTPIPTPVPEPTPVLTPVVIIEHKPVKTEPKVVVHTKHENREKRSGTNTNATLAETGAADTAALAGLSAAAVVVGFGIMISRTRRRSDQQS